MDFTLPPELTTLRDTVARFIGYVGVQGAVLAFVIRLLPGG